MDLPTPRPDEPASDARPDETPTEAPTEPSTVAAVTAAAAPPRRLQRSSHESLLGGVAGGVAEYFGIDPMLVRIAFVVAAFFGGLGVIAYVLGWVALPLAPAPAGVAVQHGDRKQLLGYALVAVGLLVVGGPFGWGTVGTGLFWPVVLIGLGVAVLVLRSRDAQRGGGPDAGPPVAPPGPAAPDESGATLAPSSPQAPAADAPTAPVTGDAPSAAAAPPGAPAVAARPRRPRSPLGTITWCALLIVAGGAWIVDAAGIAEVDAGVVLAIGLAVVGAALVVSAWIGRARGLIALGIPLALAIGVLGLLDVSLTRGIGDTTYRPRSIAALASSYELAIGRLSVDLGDVDFAGERRRVNTQLGAGRLDVTVPDDVRVVVEARAGIGSVEAFGRDRDRCCPDELRVVESGVAGGGTLLLEAEVGAGHIGVRKEAPFRGPS